MRAVVTAGTSRVSPYACILSLPTPAGLMDAIMAFTKTLSLLFPVRCSAMISTTGVGMSAQREWKDFFLPNGMGLLCMPVNQD